MPFTNKSALPVLESVTGCDALDEPTVVPGKLRINGLTEATGAGAAIPDPDKLTNCGLEAALSMIMSDDEEAPMAEGVKPR